MLISIRIPQGRMAHSVAILLRRLRVQVSLFCLSISESSTPARRLIRLTMMYGRAGKIQRSLRTTDESSVRIFLAQSKQGRRYIRLPELEYDKAYDEVMAKYHQQIYAVDVAVGMMRNALKANKVEKNTVVIFTSDNGFFLRQSWVRLQGITL